MTSAWLHVVPGPDGHGVVRHGERLQQELGAGPELLRCGRLDELPDGALAGRVVAVQVTDRVLAGSPDVALREWRRVMQGVARLTVVLHDLPQASDGRWRQERSRLYAALAVEADDVLVASGHERLLLAAALRWARPSVAEAVLRRTHVVPLPIERGAGAVRRGGADRVEADAADREPTVVTLGYVYPGKGLEEVVDAAAAAAQDPRLAGLDVAVRNLGRASDGHENLVQSLSARAEAAGVRWSTTGWVEDADLPGLLAAAGVPVAAHQHLSASGSISTWLGAGRRPLVLRSRYAVELAERMPGALRLVEPSDLAGAVAAALADPASTWLGDDVEVGPTWAEAAARLHEIASGPAVSVVVPYYRDQQLLDLILRRLDAQVGVAGGLEVVVADDGSPEPPDVSGLRTSVAVVRQEDLGFRAGAARNLGARAGRGRVLCFVDGDTVPEDGYVAALQRACLAAPTLAVGRRRHTDVRGLLTGLPTGLLTRGRGEAREWPPTQPLAEPAWLADGYAAWPDGLAARDADFRFVISAVMAASRSVWEAVGGFDEGLTGYGGEDWDLGWRAWLAGADLRHVPEAVAWHDGPDMGGREEGLDAARLAEVKNAETARLAPRLPQPLVRGRGWRHAQPDVVAVVEADGWTEGQVTVVVESLLRQGDVGVWVVGRPLDALTGQPGVHAGRPSSSVLARARALVEVTRPVAVLALPWEPWPQELTGTLPDADLTDDPASGVRVRATRHTARGWAVTEPEPPSWLPADQVEPVAPDVVVERWRQGHP